MTIREFLQSCEEVYGAKGLTDKQLQTYAGKMARFSDRELAQIYDHLLENCVRMPKIADIYDAARTLGMMTQTKEYRPHVWTPTDCSYCEGEGLMMTEWESSFEDGESGTYQVRRLVSIKPYSSAGNCGGYIFRCACAAGNLPTVPHGIPQWSTDIELVHRRKWAN